MQESSTVAEPDTRQTCFTQRGGKARPLGQQLRIALALSQEQKTRGMRCFLSKGKERIRPNYGCKGLGEQDKASHIDPSIYALNQCICFAFKPIINLFVNDNDQKSGIFIF